MPASSIFTAAHPDMMDGTQSAPAFSRQKPANTAIHGNDAPAIACKARGTPRNHAPLAITQAVFEAIARSLPLGNVSFENKTDEQGQRLIWLDRAMVDRLRTMRGPGESYSDAILWLASERVD
jgi:hypothetical protein